MDNEAYDTDFIYCLAIASAGFFNAIPFATNPATIFLPTASAQTPKAGPQMLVGVVADLPFDSFKLSVRY
jgi:hypothetical protein